MRCAHILLLLAALPSSVSAASRFNPSTATCSAPVRTQLEPAPLSAEEQNLLQQLLPQPTSKRPVVRGELRAPLHIPCQLRAFPHLPAFVSEIEHHEVPNFEARTEVKEFAQPPHVIFFDERQEVVRTIVVAPSWTGFELRDLILDNLKN
ncbi:hypothetical protein PHYSODRAFT_348612 [Phytophthora sojae]|uniref:Uncharacterized protein n=1 Tax=Phytophthora sojae (strain P6497) TaxID=1094619 RepID=G5AFZ5_PHYSP|nr:hypothetical protein PHYSODRAFT_348612 [Phytophthora sojae]EGZ05507.1 hypothetical protein PHYSODRAFT_348612 [Phytophthora sojae]|eukprot:XP_009539038.1 hypothetical protein PHYSODRAFT_348612 [Phytophthora sojae]